MKILSAKASKSARIKVFLQFFEFLFPTPKSVFYVKLSDFFNYETIKSYFLLKNCAKDRAFFLFSSSFFHFFVLWLHLNVKSKSENCKL